MAKLNHGDQVAQLLVQDRHRANTELIHMFGHSPPLLSCEVGRASAESLIAFEDVVPLVQLEKGRLHARMAWKA